jgi:hypothetical protein
VTDRARYGATVSRLAYAATRADKWTIVINGELTFVYRAERGAGGAAR